MTPLPDRTVILGLLATVALCFALVFWYVRIHPLGAPQPMLWKDSPAADPARPLI